MTDYAIKCSGKDNEICEIFVAGAVESEAAIDMLNKIWVHDLYKNARFVIWDVEQCEAFPDFNQFVRIVNHARAHKPEGGPALIAFQSSAFSNTMLSRVLQGFIRALPYRMALFDNRDAVLAWFESNRANAA